MIELKKIEGPDWAHITLSLEVEGEGVARVALVEDPVILEPTYYVGYEFYSPPSMKVLCEMKRLFTRIVADTDLWCYVDANDRCSDRFARFFGFEPTNHTTSIGVVYVRMM